MKKLLLASVASSALAAPVSAGVIMVDRTDTGIVYLQFSGKIELGDDTRFVTAWSEAQTKYGKVPTVMELNSTGGFVFASFQLAGYIRSNHLTTIVGSADVCASACFTLFAAGEKRVAGHGAKIAVHSMLNGQALDGQGKVIEDGDAAKATLLVARFYERTGVPATIIAKMVATAPDQVTELADSDLAGWATILPDEQRSAPQPAPAPAPAPRVKGCDLEEVNASDYASARAQPTLKGRELWRLPRFSSVRWCGKYVNNPAEGIQWHWISFQWPAEPWAHNAWIARGILTNHGDENEQE
jgi:hypothetical protein